MTERCRVWWCWWQTMFWAVMLCHTLWISITSWVELQELLFTQFLHRNCAGTAVYTVHHRSLGQHRDSGSQFIHQFREDETILSSWALEQEFDQCGLHQEVKKKTSVTFRHKNRQGVVKTCFIRTTLANCIPNSNWAEKYSILKSGP